MYNINIKTNNYQIRRCKKLLCKFIFNKRKINMNMICCFVAKNHNNCSTNVKILKTFSFAFNITRKYNNKIFNENIHFFFKVYYLQLKRSYERYTKINFICLRTKLKFYKNKILWDVWSLFRRQWYKKKSRLRAIFLYENKFILIKIRNFMFKGFKCAIMYKQILLQELKEIIYNFIQNFFFYFLFNFIGVNFFFKKAYIEANGLTLYLYYLNELKDLYDITIVESLTFTMYRNRLKDLQKTEKYNKDLPVKIRGYLTKIRSKILKGFNNLILFKKKKKRIRFDWYATWENFYSLVRVFDIINEREQRIQEIRSRDKHRK